MSEPSPLQAELDAINERLKDKEEDSPEYRQFIERKKQLEERLGKTP
jgi:hypothetical protein